MQDQNSVHVLWEIHGVRADVLREEQALIRLSSCSFFLQSIAKTEWSLRLSFHSDELHVCLVRKPDGRPGGIELEYEIHLFKSDGSIWRKGEKRKKVFCWGNRDYLNLASRQDLLDNSKVLMDRGVVRVSARLWPVSFSLPRPLTFYVKSRAGVSRSVLWNVEGVSGILRGEERGYMLDKLVDRPGDTHLVLFQREGKVFLLTKNIASNLIFVTVCESVSIIHPNGSSEPRLQCWKGRKILKTDDHNTYLFIEAETIADSSSYIENDELKVFILLTDYSTYSNDQVTEVIAGEIIPTVSPVNGVPTTYRAADTFSRIFDALQTQSRGVSTDDSSERGHPDCPLGSDFKSLLQEETFSDFKLQVGPESIAVHKAVLCARSPVLKAMLESPMRESCENEMDVPDFQPDTVRRLVRFLYSGSVPDLDPSAALELYEAADKYAVFALRALCSRALVSGLGVSNVCGVLSLSDRHHDSDLKGKVVDFIQMHKQEVFTSQQWLTFMREDPLLVVEVYHSYVVN